MPITFTAPEHGTQQIEMYGQGDQLRVVEILTDAGIIRVNTNLVTVQAGVPVVVVQVEPNWDGWAVESTRRHDSRIDVSLTKRAE